MIANFLAFCQKHFFGVVKTGFYVSFGTFWSKKLFLKVFQFLKHTRTFSKKFSAFYQKKFCGAARTPAYVSVSTGTFKSDKNFWKKFMFFSNSSEHSEKSFRLSAKKKLVRLSTLLSIIHRAMLKKKFLWNKHGLFITFGFWAKFSQLFVG